MNYKDAKELKAIYGSTFTSDNVIYKVTIVPENEKDFIDFCSEYRISNFNDENAIQFSKNLNFAVCGLWTDGVNVIKSKLIDKEDKT